TSNVTVALPGILPVAVGCAIVPTAQGVTSQGCLVTCCNTGWLLLSSVYVPSPPGLLKMFPSVLVPVPSSPSGKILNVFSSIGPSGHNGLNSKYSGAAVNPPPKPNFS